MGKFVYVLLLYVYLGLVLSFFLLPPMTFGWDFSQRYALLVLCLKVWLGLALAAVVWLTIDQVRLLHRDDLEPLRRAALLTKAMVIPWFLLNFVGCILFLLAAVGASRGFFALLLPVAVPVQIALTWLVFLPTSIPPICFMAALHRRNALTGPVVALHLVLQLLFVVDIFSTAWLVFAHRPAARLDGTDQEEA